ncbi:MAG: SpoIIE family protein phosphatase [Clostridia bacterium]|nr:SpoIIE family protein phosphatase [Clostridia bacterium]
MKELIKKTQESYLENKREFINALSLHILATVIGFIAARGLILGSLMPFGIIFVGGSSSVFLPSVAVGSFLGYFFPATSGGFRYIAALLAVVSIRLLLSNFKKICENPVFLSVITSIANLVTGIVSYSGTPIDAIKLAAESIIILGGVFVVYRAFVALNDETAGFSFDSLVCLLSSATILIIGIARFLVFGLSVGFILGIVLILVSSKYAGAAASAASGIALSFVAAATNAFESGFGIYAFAGLACGIFSSLGKYAQSVSVIATGIIGLSFMQFKDGSSAFLTEILIGALFFLLIPRSAGIHIGKFFFYKPQLQSSESVNHALSLRLNLASSALVDVSDTVSQVSQELGKINAPDFKNILSFIEQDACAGCKLRLHCWENKNADTVAAVMKMINIVKGCDTSDSDTSLNDFRGRCLRVKKVEDAVQNRYSAYASLISAENRIDEVRQVVSEQFEGISVMLDELALSLEDEQQFDYNLAESAVSALKNIGIHATSCSAKIDKFTRLSLEIKISLLKETVLNRMQIMKILSLACERDFDIPNITKSGDFAVITVNEHPNFRIDIGVEQRSAQSGTICGDAYKYFNDGKGHFIMLLSDGMGTGGRAAVDGAMASGLMSRLLKAGFGYDCSLKILNSSMLFKSSDESLATMDVASIDLFSGNVELYKAGAAPTLVRRGGHSGRAESNSLPIGILKDVSFDRAGIKLKSGDILLLASDGVTFDGTEWIRAELENWRDGSAQDLAEYICDCARRRSATNRQDDITVMAAILEKTD